METSGVAVGCGWQQFVAYVNVGSYYIVGVPLGVVLGFFFNLGAKVMDLSDKFSYTFRDGKIFSYVF